MFWSLSSLRFIFPDKRSHLLTKTIVFLNIKIMIMAVHLNQTGIQQHTGWWSLIIVQYLSAKSFILQNWFVAFLAASEQIRIWQEKFQKIKTGNLRHQGDKSPCFFIYLLSPLQWLSAHERPTSVRVHTKIKKCAIWRTEMGHPWVACWMLASSYVKDSLVSAQSSWALLLRTGQKLAKYQYAHGSSWLPYWSNLNINHHRLPGYNIIVFP